MQNERHGYMGKNRNITVERKELAIKEKLIEKKI